MFRKLACGVLALVLAGAVHAGDANEILAKVKAASGGAAWDGIHTARTRLTVSVGGLTGTAEALDDVTSGRYVDHFKLGPMSGAEGYDGAVAWSQDASGQSRAEEGGDGRLGAVNESYRRAYGFYYPERWPAQIEDAGTREESGRRLLVVRITPRGGRPFEEWIDAATMLIDRTVEKAATETRTTFMTDYKTVGGVKMAFATRSSNGDPRYDQRVTVENVELNVQVDAAVFKLPAPPPPDFALAGGKTSTTVPFELVNNHIYVDVKLNGKGPYRLLCDTGGANVVSPELAKELGLSSEGALEGRGVGEKSEDFGVTKVERLEIGEATIANQVFIVFPLGQFVAVEGVPEFGLVGYEVLKRFVARVDYEKKLLTLTLPSAFEYHGTGTVVPFTFNENTPQVDGSLDGIAGRFDIDTGARDSVSILAPFAEQHGLKERYRATVAAVTGWGAGGPARSLVTRAKTLRLGTLEVADPVVDLSQQKKGAFTDPYVAGNVGGGVLKRFNVTFDYGHQRLIFEANANHDLPDTYDRAGMWINRGAEGFEVVDVVAGGPAAAAGLTVGDRITAIAGAPAGQLALPTVRERFRTEPAGTKITLAVTRDGTSRSLELVLRDLVPASR
jgi:hypothetical protein